MLGIILYEVVDIIYHLGKIGVNCIGTGLSLLYDKETTVKRYTYREVEYIEKIQELERKILLLENGSN